MSGCCDPRGYEAMFESGFSGRMARKYRRRGLDATATRLVSFLADGDLRGATVLEVGGGVGQIGIELLRRGAASVTNVELSTAYDRDAARLAADAGVGDRVERRIVDIAASPSSVSDADLVVLHRVVCCYPDYERLLGVAADRCRRRLAFSHPPRTLLTRFMTASENAGCRVTGKSFRTFVHPPDAMVDVVASRGLRPVHGHRGTLWQVHGLAR